MRSFPLANPATHFPKITLEQLEERIVLDGAVDDPCCRADLFSAQVGATHTDSDQMITEAVLAQSRADVDTLVLETGTEWLPDGTWHYWEQDWDASGNGYRFDSWKDGTHSYHARKWDANFNGYSYNEERDGTWTYDSVDWDKNHNGYSYYATSSGTFDYVAHHWENGFGYDYTKDSEQNWTYHTVIQGKDPGDQLFFMGDSTGWC